MRRSMAAGLLLLVVAAGCNDATTPKTPPGGPGFYVLNSLGETIDWVDPATGRVEKGAVKTGSQPNDILIDEEAGRIYVANSGDNTVWRLDLTTLRKEAEYPLGPNSNPYALELLPDGSLAVSNWLSGDVAFFDAAGSLVRRVAVGQTPEALLHYQDRLYVTVVDYDLPTYSFGQGEVVVIPDGASQSGPRVPVAANPQGLLIAADGRLHVVCTGAYDPNPPGPGVVMVLDPATLAVEDTIRVGGSPASAKSGINDAVYLSGFFGGLMKYDSRTHQVLRGAGDPVLARQGLGQMMARGVGLAVPSFDDDAVYVISTAADTVVATWAVGDGPIKVAFAGGP